MFHMQFMPLPRLADPMLYRLQLSLRLQFQGARVSATAVRDVFHVQARRWGNFGWEELGWGGIGGRVSTIADRRVFHIYIIGPGVQAKRWGSVGWGALGWEEGGVRLPATAVRRARRFIAPATATAVRRVRRVRRRSCRISCI